MKKVGEMSKTLKHEIKADYLLEKGMEIIWSRGYNATSVNDIVKAADVPKGSFYFYFDSKEDFVVKALDKYFTSVSGPAIEILKNKKLSPKQRLLDFYEFRSNVVKEDLDCKMGCMASNLSIEMSDHNENIRNAVNSIHTIIRDYIIEVVQEAQDSGELDTFIEASELVNFIENAGIGAMTRMREMQSPDPIDNFLNMVRAVLLK